MFVNWLQLGVLGIEGPAVGKAAADYLGATRLSWITAILLRRIPVAGNVIQLTASGRALRAEAAGPAWSGLRPLSGN